MANILTDAAATYAATTVLATTKVDSEVRTDAESDEIAIASWFTEIDTAVKKVNAFLVGSQSAGRAGNTTALLGALSVAQALSAASAAIVGAITAASATLGDGSGTPTLTLNKVATGQARIDFKDAGVLRWREAMDGGENFIIERYDGTGALVDTPLTIDDSTGAITSPSTIDGKLEDSYELYCSSASTAVQYFSFADLVESTTITGYRQALIAPHDGYIESVYYRTSADGGTTVIGLHKNDNTTPSCSQSQAVGAATTVLFDTWTGTTTFSKGDRLHLSFDPTNIPTDVTAILTLRFTTTT